MLKITLRTSLQVGLSIALACIALSTRAASTTVTFEGTGGVIANSYAGLSGWDALGSVQDSGWGTGVGDYYFHGNYGSRVLTFESTPVVFEGMYYNTWTTGYVPTYTLYYHDAAVFSAFVDADAQPSELYWLSSGYTGLIDKIEFHGDYDGYAFDNLTYVTAAVPEPETYVLLLSGLVLVGGIARRRSFVQPSVVLRY